MELMLVLIAAVLLVANLLMSGALLGVVLGREQFRRSEGRAQAAMDEQVEEELRRGRAMDEGVDNLMRLIMFFEFVVHSACGPDDIFLF